jgi:hypothetical protein
MEYPDFSFTINEKVRVHVDFARKRVMISCETYDGKSLHLETDYQTINRIHDELHKQLEAS